MQLHVYQPPKPEPEIYLSQSGYSEELWRSVDIALLATETGGPIIFNSPADEWQSWLTGDFSQTVAPHLVQARSTAAGGVAIRELGELDVKFDQQLLDDEARKRSIETGLKLLERNDGAKRVEPIAKLKRSIESGDCPGHAATVFALQCALFNLPVAATLTSYLCLEWRAASGRNGWRDEFERHTPNLAACMPNWLQTGEPNLFIR